MKWICNLSPQIVVFYRASPRHKLKIVKVSAPKKFLWSYNTHNNTCLWVLFLASVLTEHRCRCCNDGRRCQWRGGSEGCRHRCGNGSDWHWCLQRSSRHDPGRRRLSNYHVNLHFLGFFGFIRILRTIDVPSDESTHVLKPLFLNLGLLLKKGKGYTTTLRTLCAFSWARKLKCFHFDSEMKRFSFYVYLWCTWSQMGCAFF